MALLVPDDSLRRFTAKKLFLATNKWDVFNPRNVSPSNALFATDGASLISDDMEPILLKKSVL